jgi:predicted Fe-S protein YdhL (DUF1289 family)
MNETGIETPCIKVCLMDPRTNLCSGCGRTLAEIARWGRIDNAERRAIMSGLKQRMLNAGMAKAENSGT